MSEFRFDMGDKLRHKSPDGPKGKVVECYTKNNKHGYCLLDDKNKPHFVDEEDLERDR